MQKEHVASAVYFSTEQRPDIVIQFTLSSVATKSLAQTEARFFEVLKETAEKELDMIYMKDCVSRERRQVKFEAESSGNFFTDSIIVDFLFGMRDGTNLRDLKSLQEYDTLETWTDSQWKDLLRKWISGANHITIIGKPSASLARGLKTEEEDRIAKQKEKLGKEGLEELEKRLAQAKADNDKEIPREIFARFKVPGTKSIHFMETTTARSGSARMIGLLDNPIQKIVDGDELDLSLFIHFEHVQTNFIHLTLLVSTESVPIPLRPLLSVYVENFFNSPVLRNGKRIEFEQVIMDLEKDTIAYGIDSAARLGNPEVLSIQLQIEAGKYETAIQWLNDLLFEGVFDETVHPYLRKSPA